MNGNKGVVSKRLVVYFCDSGCVWYLSNVMVQDDKGIRPQLVHTQRIHRTSSPPPSRLDRLLTYLRIKSRPPKEPQVDHRNDQALTDAHGFVSRNYRSGDQVVLVADFIYGADYVIKWMEVFASHLYSGATPDEPSTVSPEREKTGAGQRVPIYAVAVIGSYGCNETVSLLNSRMKSRLPPGVEHIFYSGWFGSDFCCCSTTFDYNGEIISRELSIYDWRNSSSTSIHGSKDIIYYISEEIQDWDKRPPVWTKVMDSTPIGIHRNLLLSTPPPGMHRHELRRYKVGSSKSHRLEWKSFRD